VPWGLLTKIECRLVFSQPVLEGALDLRQLAAAGLVAKVLAKEWQKSLQ
jgi:hypothetical protein